MDIKMMTPAVFNPNYKNELPPKFGVNRYHEITNIIYNLVSELLKIDLQISPDVKVHIFKDYYDGQNVEDSDSITIMYTGYIEDDEYFIALNLGAIEDCYREYSIEHFCYIMMDNFAHEYRHIYQFIHKLYPNMFGNKLTDEDYARNHDTIDFEIDANDYSEKFMKKYTPLINNITKTVIQSHIKYDPTCQLQLDPNRFIYELYTRKVIHAMLTLCFDLKDTNITLTNSYDQYHDYNVRYIEEIDTYNIVFNFIPIEYLNRDEDIVEEAIMFFTSTYTAIYCAKNNIDDLSTTYRNFIDIIFKSIRDDIMLHAQQVYDELMMQIY